MALASSRTSCLRASKRVTAIDMVNPSSRPRTPTMEPATTEISDFVFSVVLDSAWRPRQNPASFTASHQHEKQEGDDPFVNSVEEISVHSDLRPSFPSEK
jgi:hypothetical protein